MGFWITLWLGSTSLIGHSVLNWILVFLILFLLLKVPQGSILGPTLFINNIPHAAHNSFIYLYADGTILFATGPSPASVVTLPQDSLLLIQQAFNNLYFSLNPTKTKVMWFGRRGAEPSTSIEITTREGMVLEPAITYKYLGIWLDSTLSFSSHPSKLQSKLRQNSIFYIEIALCSPQQPNLCLFK